MARKYDGAVARSRRGAGPGRPRTGVELEALVVRMAEENPTFGYTRLRDALGNVGLEVGRSTVAEVLRRNGLEPAPERGRKTTWKQFLAAHWDVLAGADSFTVEVLT